MLQYTNSDKTYDIIIAGAGLAGLLSATRFRQIYPSARILLVERETRLGGRLRIPELQDTLGAGGLHYISRDLLEFLNRTLLGCGRGEEDLTLPNQAANSMGILQGKKLDELALAEFCSAQVAKIIGGPSAAKQWETFVGAIESCSQEDLFQQLGKFANITKKDPFLDLLNVMSIPLGILTPWMTTVASFQQRARYIAKGLYGGPWTKVIDDIVRWNDLEVRNAKQILGANFESRQWTLQLENEQVSTKALVVAQSPWDAMGWLKREHCPAGFIHLALKFAPLSAVALTLRFTDELSMPDRILIPSERAQVLRLSKSEICIQVLIDYETFLDAPRVVQAVKQTRRSKEKLCKFLGIAEPAEEFLALRPVAWAQETHFDARKYVEEYDATKLNSSQLVFCGDAYGSSYDPDQNLIKSCLAACSTVVI